MLQALETLKRMVLKRTQQKRELLALEILFVKEIPGNKKQK